MMIMALFLAALSTLLSVAFLGLAIVHIAFDIPRYDIVVRAGDVLVLPAVLCLALSVVSFLAGMVAKSWL